MVLRRGNIIVEIAIIEVAVNRRGKRAPRIFGEPILIQVHPNIVQVFETVVGIVQRYLSAQHIFIGVHRGLDFIIGPVLPITRSGFVRGRSVSGAVVVLKITELGLIIDGVGFLCLGKV